MKKKIGIVLTVLLVTAACLLSGWLLIGEPVDASSWHIRLQSILPIWIYR